MHCQVYSARGGADVVFQSLADLDGDGHPDLVVCNYPANGIVFFNGLPDGSFADGNPAVTGTRSVFATVADFNNDGLPDILLNSPYEQRFVLLTAQK